MQEMYENMQNQIETIKFFFIKKRKVLVIILVLGIATALASLFFWSNHFLNRTHETPQSYETIINSVCFNDPKTLANAEKFIFKNRDIYGAMVSLKIAKLYVDNNELDKAIVQLQQGISSVNDDNLKSLINLRLARIEIQQKKADDALKTLYSIKGKGFTAIVADLRGEALLSKGDKQNAYGVWEIGMKNNTSTILHEIMKMKINNLSL